MTTIVLFLVSLVLLSQAASAHHVYGIEVSPAFELFHSLAEPSVFALSGACLAVFLTRRAKGSPKSIPKGSPKSRFGGSFGAGSFWTTFVFGGTALAFALASVLEEGAGLFLLWDALAGVAFFALVKRGLQRKHAAKHF